MATYIKAKHEGDLRVVGETIELYGMLLGNAAVERGGVLELRGQVDGNVVIRAGGTVHLRGMVNGDVTNDGGELEVYGMVNGRVHRLSGRTFIDKKAVIG